MNYSPSFDEGFYRVDVNASRYEPSWIRNPDDEKGVRGFGKKVFARLWNPPSKGDDDAPMIWSSLHLKSLAARWQISPLRFLNKLLSLSAIPTFWAFVFWAFTTYVLEEKIPTSCYVATFFSVWTLRDAVLTVSMRPKLRELIGLMCHQLAAYWLCYCAGTIFYLFSKYSSSGSHNTTKWEAFIAGGVFYLFIIGSVANRRGASGSFRYLGQALMVVVTTLALLAAAYGVFYGFSYPIWKCQSWALFWGGIIGFWAAVNLFYKPSPEEARSRETSEPIISE